MPVNNVNNQTESKDCAGCSSCADSNTKRGTLYGLFLAILGFVMQYSWAENLLFASAPIYAFSGLTLLLAHFCWIEFDRTWASLVTFTKNLVSKKQKFDWSWLKMPSMDSIVMLSIFVAWLASALAVFTGAGSILLHDAILSAGVFAYSRNLRGHLPKAVVDSAGDMTVTLSNGQTKPVRDLVIGDEFQINQTMEAPVDLVFTGEYTQDESRVNGTNVPVKASTPVHRGQARVTASYQPQQFRDHELDDNVVKYFLLAFYAISLVFSSLVSWQLGLLEGIRRLTQCLMLVCPCVYLSIKTRVQSSLKKFSSDNGYRINKLPTIGGRVVAVFDRTRTLAFQDQTRPNEDFNIAPDKLNMIRRLRDKGIPVLILSAHDGSDQNGEPNEAIRERRRIEMRNLLGLEDHQVMFGCSNKQDEIKKIKRNVSALLLGRNPNWWDKLVGVFRPNTVIMVGNDHQDVAAMQASHCSVLVGSGFGTSNAHDISILDHSMLNTFDQFIDRHKKNSLLIRVLNGLVMLISSVALAFVLGFSFGSFALAPGMVCSFSSFICLFASIRLPTFGLKQFFKLKSVESTPIPDESKKPKSVSPCEENNCSGCKAKRYNNLFDPTKFDYTRTKRGDNSPADTNLTTHHLPGQNFYCNP